ncbi:MAG: penicillin-binding protein 2 [Planctomycetota bacterium]
MDKPSELISESLPHAEMAGNSIPAASSSPGTDKFHQSCRGWVHTEGAGASARLRIGFILGFVLLLYVGLSLRLAQIQVLQGNQWRHKAMMQQVAFEPMPAPRGGITDRRNLPLAFSIPRETIIADLKLLKDREGAARQLAPILSIPAKTLSEKMSRDDRRVVYLARNVGSEIADKIRALKIRGIGFEDEFRRAYPQGALACHVLGWAGVDGGMEGLELELNGILSGTPGYLRYYRDAAQRIIALNDNAIGAGDTRPPRDGLAVTLTIDARVQQAAQDEAARIHQEYQPKSVVCVVIDVSNGAILALASTPEFDPNAPAKYHTEDRRNRVVCDVYEPGSTFKTFIAAMSLERKLWRRNETIFCENGAWPIGYRTLHDAHAYGTLSVDDVIAKSSNIGAAKIALRLGVDGLYETATAFGFGALTHINIPGEVKGIVRPRKVWTYDSIYSVAIGHEIAVTPIQLAMAYSAVVNGGVLYRPKIVQRIMNEKGEELYTLHPQPQRRVISEQTSQQMREILARVVQPGGTGTRAFCAEFQIGGKTGTSKKIDPVTKTYSNTQYVSSFCGFAPVNHPRLVCLVAVDEPRKGIAYYGGTVCCPAVREVLRKGLSVLNVLPRSADEQKKAIAESRALAAQ